MTTRVRRFHLTELLTRNGFACSNGTLSTSGAHGRRVAARDGQLAAYASRLFDAEFVLSPNGKGRACHREWEALVAGAIPLVDWDPSRAVAELYEGLPVVRVKDWSQISTYFLRNELQRIQAAARRREIDLKKLYLPYWIARFTEHLHEARGNS